MNAANPIFEISPKVFFTLFPKGYWITIIAGVLAELAVPEIRPLPFAAINLAVFLIALRTAIIIHETGHLLAARIAGGLPKRMILGKGHELYRCKIQGVSIIINSSLTGGFAYASFRQLNFLKLRYAFYIFGGVLANATTAMIFYLLFDLPNLTSGSLTNLDIASSIVLANSVMLMNLIPYTISFQGVRIPNDGLSLVKIPFTKVVELRRTLDMDQLFEAQEAMELRDYPKAMDLFTGYLKKHDESQIIRLSIAFLLIKTGQVDAGITEASFLESLNDKEIKKYNGTIFNLLAWAYLVKGDLDLANHYSTAAIKLIPNENHIRGTRGSVLIEKGLINEGMSLLFHTMDFNYTNSATLSAAIYLMLAYHLKGNNNERDRHLNFVNINQAKLDADERILFERNRLIISGEPIPAAPLS